MTAPAPISVVQDLAQAAYREFHAALNASESERQAAMWKLHNAMETALGMGAELRAALLHQLAELEAEVERLRRDYKESCDITREWIAANNALSARAEAAERARDEATGLLRDAFDSIIKAAALAGIDPIPAPEPNSIGGRIAAFLAASGGK